MHPALAIWIWSMAMARACFGQGPENLAVANGASGAFLQNQQVSHQSLIRASQYLHSDLSNHPLPNELLDRLADLYWAERDGHLAI